MTADYIDVRWLTGTQPHILLPKKLIRIWFVYSGRNVSFQFCTSVCHQSFQLSNADTWFHLVRYCSTWQILLRRNLILLRILQCLTFLASIALVTLIFSSLQCLFPALGPNSSPIRVVQVLTKCQGHHHTGNGQLTPIKTSSLVVEVVKLMAWRQAISPLKIPSWSGGKMSSSHIF